MSVAVRSLCVPSKIRVVESRHGRGVQPPGRYAPAGGMGCNDTRFPGASPPPRGWARAGGAGRVVALIPPRPGPWRACGSQALRGSRFRYAGRGLSCDRPASSADKQHTAAGGGESLIGRRCSSGKAVAQARRMHGPIPSRVISGANPAAQSAPALNTRTVAWRKARSFPGIGIEDRRRRRQDRGGSVSDARPDPNLQDSGASPAYCGARRA